MDIEYDLKLDRYKTHDIDIVIDRWIIGENATENRMEKSLRTAMETVSYTHLDVYKRQV